MAAGTTGAVSVGSTCLGHDVRPDSKCRRAHDLNGNGDGRDEDDDGDGERADDLGLITGDDVAVGVGRRHENSEDNNAQRE